MNPDSVIDMSVYGPSLDDLEHLGDLSETLGRGVFMACRACLVSWTGCAAAYECPRCGDSQPWFADGEFP